MSSAQPYGNKGHYGPGEVPEPERTESWRYGYRVESDSRGPQQVGSESSGQRAVTLAKAAAQEQRTKLRALGIMDAVVPWTQRSVRTVTVSFDVAHDHEPQT